MMNQNTAEFKAAKKRRPGFNPTWLHEPDVRERAAETSRANPKKGHKEAMYCAECGEFFFEYPSRRTGEVKYCSTECRTNSAQNLANLRTN